MMRNKLVEVETGLHKDLVRQLYGDDEPLEAPKRGFWVGMGWAVVITAGMVLVIAAGFQIWG